MVFEVNCIMIIDHVILSCRPYPSVSIVTFYCVNRVILSCRPYPSVSIVTFYCVNRVILPCQPRHPTVLTSFFCVNRIICAVLLARLLFDSGARLGPIAADQVWPFKLQLRECEIVDSGAVCVG
jgi:hypothetical protein